MYISAVGSKKGFAFHLSSQASPFSPAHQCRGGETSSGHSYRLVRSIEIIIVGGRGRTRDNLPVIDVFGELVVRYQKRIAQKSYSTAFNEMRFQENAFPQNAFLQNAGNS